MRPVFPGLTGRRGGASRAGLRVLVTGARGGIGSAARRLMESHGAAVVGLDRAAGRPGDVVADVRDDDGVSAAVRQAVDRLGGLDVLVNCAGVGDPVDAGAPPDATVRRLLDVNLLGTWRVTAAALPALIASRGRVVCIASGLAVVTIPYAAAYAASKRAVTAYADALRLEYGDRVTVTTVYPGYIRTAIHESSGAVGLRLRDFAPEESLGDAARGILRAATGRPRRDVALTPTGTATLLAGRHLPGVVDRVVRRRSRDVVATAPPATWQGSR